LNFADPSNTGRIFVVDRSSLITAKCGRYQQLLSLSIDTSLI